MLPTEIMAHILSFTKDSTIGKCRAVSRRIGSIARMRIERHEYVETKYGWHLKTEAYLSYPLFREIVLRPIDYDFLIPWSGKKLHKLGLTANQWFATMTQAGYNMSWMVQQLTYRYYNQHGGDPTAERTNAFNKILQNGLYNVGTYAQRPDVRSVYDINEDEHIMNAIFKDMYDPDLIHRICELVSILFLPRQYLAIKDQISEQPVRLPVGNRWNDHLNYTETGLVQFVP